MTVSLTFALLLALAVVVIVMLIVICMRLQSQVSASVRDLTSVQTQLNSRNDDLMQLQTQINNLAQRQYTAWREREVQTIREELHKTIMGQAQNAFQQWQVETEANIRADAIRRSSAVVSGKVTEHLTPYLGVFPYNPKDARFLGAQAVGGDFLAVGVGGGRHGSLLLLSKMPGSRGAGGGQLGVA